MKNIGETCRTKIYVLYSHACANSGASASPAAAAAERRDDDTQGYTLSEAIAESLCGTETIGETCWTGV